jgi:Fe-S oxidoreductase
LLSLPETAIELAPLSTASLTFFDSCHDRYDNRHAKSIRKLLKLTFPNTLHREMDHSKKGTLCCGAGGAVAPYDPDITKARVWRIINEAKKTGAETLVSACPTCTYTIAQARLEAGVPPTIQSYHYLELLMGKPIDWALVFYQLESMWTGEYGPWLTETFFGGGQ